MSGKVLTMDTAAVRRTRSGKLKVDCAQKDRTIPVFLTSIVALTVISLVFLDIPWLRLLSRVPDIGTIFWKLLHFDFDKLSLIGSSLLETLSITSRTICF